MPSSGETYRVAAYECDQNSVLQLATIFNWLQDAMDRYSQKHKIGHDFCQKNNITYMLKGYDVLIDSLPKWMDSVAISTDLVNAARCSLFFKQTMSDMHTQKTLLSSVSHVVLIDLLNRRPIRVNGNLSPELKFYSNRVKMDEQFNTSIAGLHCLGDSSGWTRGLMMASVMGVIMGQQLAKEN